MGYKVNFLDNELVSAADLNAMAAALGGDASGFADDMVYGVDDLNDISSTLISKGVSQGCTLSATVGEDGGGTVTVGAGVLFMSGGKRVEIDSGGVSLSFASGSLHYVWFQHDTVTGFVTPCCTTTAPGGDYVLLGQVTAAGTAVTRPERAVMKNSFAGLNKTESFTVSLPGGGTTEEVLLCELTPAQVGYNRVLLYSPGYDNKQAFCGFADLSTGTAFSTLCRSTYESGTSNGYNAFAGERTDGLVLAGIESCTGAQNWHYLYLRPQLTSDGRLQIYKMLVRTGIGGSMTAYTRTVTVILC
ncbi:MAG: hypothetical protein ACI4QW_02610 [Clostridia bacterium]